MFIHSLVSRYLNIFLREDRLNCEGWVVNIGCVRLGRFVRFKRSRVLAVRSTWRISALSAAHTTTVTSQDLSPSASLYAHKRSNEIGNATKAFALGALTNGTKRLHWLLVITANDNIENCFTENLNTKIPNTILV